MFHQIVLATLLVIVTSMSLGYELNGASDYTATIAITLGHYFGPIYELLGSVQLVAISAFVISLFKRIHLLILILANLVLIVVLVFHIYILFMLIEDIRKNFYMYLIFSVLFELILLSGSIALYYAVIMVYNTHLIVSITFSIIALILIILLFSLPPTSYPLHSLFSGQKTNPIIIEEGGNQRIGPSSTLMSIEAMNIIRFAPLDSLIIRKSKDDVLVGASELIKDVENIKFAELKTGNEGKIYLKSDPYRTFHELRDETKYLNFDYNNFYENISQKLEQEGIDSLKELLIQGMRISVSQVLDIYPYKDEATETKVAGLLISALEDLGLAQPDKAGFYSIKTSEFLIYKILASKYYFIEFILPIQAFKEEWCEKVDPNLCVIEKAHSYQTLIDAERAINIAKHTDQTTTFYDLVAVNSVASLCLAKYIGFVRVFSSLSNEEVMQSCYTIQELNMVFSVIGIIICLTVLMLVYKIYIIKRLQHEKS